MLWYVVQLVHIFFRFSRTMECYLRDDEIEKALEEIFGIPDDGSEDGNESDGLIRLISVF